MFKCVRVLVVAYVVVNTQCRALSVDNPVVSVYTTKATPMDSGRIHDIYQQIANNIAERITNPIYRFFGYNTDVEDKKTQVQDNSTEIDENIEDLSVEGIIKSMDALNDKAENPEKLTLYSSLLPIQHSLQLLNETELELDDLYNLTEPDELTPNDNQPFSFVYDLFSNLAQMVYGGIMSLFKPFAGNVTSTECIPSDKSTYPNILTYTNLNKSNL